MTCDLEFLHRNLGLPPCREEKDIPVVVTHDAKDLGYFSAWGDDR